MLIRLEINNFAVISGAVLEPGGGLNAISGETGAGKSLLIDAIDLILGGKASKNLIRTGEDTAYVEAVFDISGLDNSQLLEILNDSGIDIEDDQLIISRRISRDGKSIARVNGRTVVLAVLKAISAFLVNIHGQHDTQKIFDESSHVDLLDRFGGADLLPFISSYEKLLSKYKEIVLDIRRLSAMPGSMDARKEYLINAVKEISDASFAQDEEDKLTSENRRFKMLEKNASILSEADELINSEDGSGYNVIDRIKTCASSIEKLANNDDEYKDIADKLRSLLADAENVSAELSDIAQGSSFSQEQADAVTKRLGLLYDLKAKYSCTTVDELNSFRFKAEDELNDLKESGEMLAVLRKERAKAEAELLDAAERLTFERRKCAERLSVEITEQLKDLEMPRAKFSVDFIRRNKDRFFSAHGIDDIVFMFTANPGEDSKSLAATASGGEASRIMLAIKCILSYADTVPTLIFDEIDTGVSGKASAAIANKLHMLARDHQVLCVTHTSQIAAASDNNFLISKNSAEDSTSATVTRLDEEKKILEVSRLLSGTVSDESVDLAKKLVEEFS